MTVATSPAPSRSRIFWNETRAPRVIAALVAAIQPEAGAEAAGWLDAGNKSRHDNGNVLSATHHWERESETGQLFAGAAERFLPKAVLAAVSCG